MLKINQITIAGQDCAAMAAFYNAVLGCKFAPVEAFAGATLYSGRLAGVNALICPEEVAGVHADRNRHQFTFAVDDVQRCVDAALSNGGRILTDIEEANGMKTASVFDPDGNSMVFEEAIK